MIVAVWRDGKDGKGGDLSLILGSLLPLLGKYKKVPFVLGAELADTVRER